MDKNFLKVIWKDVFFYKNRNNAGWIFLDYRNNITHLDKNTILEKIKGKRFVITIEDGTKVGGLGSMVEELELTGVVNSLTESGMIDSLYYIIPITLVLLLLTFVAYSLLAGVLASMTTNLEDFQQLQTPIVIISLVGYYLSMMASMFSGSVFIKIMSYVPFISSMLAPTLYVMGEIGLIDLIISILLLSSY